MTNCAGNETAGRHGDERLREQSRPLGKSDVSEYTIIVQQLPRERKSSGMSLKLDCAALLMDVVPLTMRYIRVEMRSRRMRGLSITQFRALIFLYGNQGTSLSQVASHIGLTLPSASKTIDALVRRGLVTRTTLPDDRRYVSLKLSRLGRATLAQARQGTEARLAERIAKLSPEQQAVVSEAMQALHTIFVSVQAPSAKKGR
jgi:DNA-binding MarR family transcriptional regulator